MDEVLTKKIQDWLATPEEKRDLHEGIEMFHRLSRNRVLYQRMLQFPQKLAKKVEYELQKYLKIRLDGLTARDCVIMDQTVVAAAAESLANGAPETADTVTETAENADETDKKTVKHLGKREDHDALPEKIKAYYDRNGEVYLKMKQEFATLKTMNNEPSCDRYEHLKVLKALDAEYRENWKRYDEYDPTKVDETEESQNAAPTAKEVSAARKFISTNRKKFEEGLGEDEAAELRDQMQERVNLILASGGGFKNQEELEQLGLTFG